MPTYEYACEACQHEFEEFQSITAPPLKKCPKCGKPRLRRLIGTGAGVLFKGSGFYQTDYRSESYKKAAEAETKAPASEKTETKTDSAGKESTPAASPTEKNPAAAPAPTAASGTSKPKSGKHRHKSN